MAVSNDTTYGGNLYAENYNPSVAFGGGTVTKKPALFLGPVTFGGGTATTVQPLASAAVVTVPVTAGAVFLHTPTQNETINTAIVVAGQSLRFIILTSGTTSYTLTFGTNFRSSGNLSTGVVSGRYFLIEFVSDGTNYIELTRSVAE